MAGRKPNKLLNSNGVYKITCIPTGKCYIGSAARTFTRRFQNHRSDLRLGVHSSRYMQHAWNKYGEEAFRFDVIIICRPEDCIMYEQLAMDSIKPEFNIVKTAGSCLGHKKSDEERAKCRERMLGKKQSPEVIAKRVASRAGYRCSPETRAKMSASGGHPQTPESREKIRLAKRASAPRFLVRGEELTLMELHEKYGVKYNTLHLRMQKGWRGEELIRGSNRLQAPKDNSRLHYGLPRGEFVL